MKTAHINIEVVSVEEAKRILKQEQLLARRNGKRRITVVKHSRKYQAGSDAKSKSPGGSKS
jgi:hypothetical protein